MRFAYSPIFHPVAHLFIGILTFGLLLSILSWLTFDGTKALIIIALIAQMVACMMVLATGFWISVRRRRSARSH
jgi:hypothetical protein